MQEEESFQAETPVGKVSAKGSLVVVIVLVAMATSVLAYGLHLHHNSNEYTLETIARNTRVTNCLLAIPIEQRKDTWRLRECVLEGDLFADRKR
jgi:hypothetical protein